MDPNEFAQSQIKLESDLAQHQQMLIQQNMSLFSQHQNPANQVPNQQPPPNAQPQPNPNNLILDSSEAVEGLDPNSASNNLLDDDLADEDDDAEGVWSPDIETCFNEALQMYPPCGRRKIILSEEGKMYGRNELIARYIKIRTGKTRTRKQVSSHIQVLARRKMREVQVSVKAQPLSPIKKEGLLTSLANMSSAQIVSAAASAKTMQQTGGLGFGYAGNSWNRNGIGLTNEVQDAFTATRLISSNAQVRITHFEVLVEPSKHITHKQDENSQSCFKSNHDKFHCILQINPVLSPNTIQMENIEINAFADKFPKNKFTDLFDKSPNKECFYLIKFWADLNFDFGEHEKDAFYNVTQSFESQHAVKIQVTTDVISFAKEAVEKIEVEQSNFDETIGRYITRINKGNVCDYMVKFIDTLKQLPDKSMVESVLENFTILQTIINRDTDELLFCIAFVFEATFDGGPHHHIYQLVKSLDSDQNNNENGSDKENKVQE